MNESLAGCRVVVSGAAGGVGRSVVEALLMEGAFVCATDISDDLAALENEARGGAIVTVKGDVSKSADVDRIFGLAEERFGGVDALVNNAARIICNPVHETSEEEWDNILDTNVKSFFLMAKRALPQMLARGSGAIVATASISGMLGSPALAAYCASKGAVVQLTRQMAIEYAGKGIRVNAVGPGGINTPFLMRYLESLPDPEAARKEVRRIHPMGRWAEPKEIADAILFLLGPKASFITGQILMVDGGYSAQ